MKAFRIVMIVLLVLVIGLGAAWQYYTAREAIPEQTNYVIDLPTLRASAASMRGPLPLRINHQVVARSTLPRAGVFAGESFEPHPMVHGVYQIVYPEGDILVDAGIGRESFEAQMGGEGARYDDDAFEIVKRALGSAGAVVLTHEHFDHMEGLAHVDDFEDLAARLVVNRAQLENPQTVDFLPAALMHAIEPVDVMGPLPIAPGVVLLPAPGHTPGSQIVYVRLQSGTEYLLIGDVAWHMDALRELHYRPRLVTDLFLGEDRGAVMAQFRALHDLLDAPGLEIVVSHDVDQRRALVEAHKLGDGLEAPIRQR